MVASRNQALQLREEKYHVMNSESSLSLFLISVVKFVSLIITINLHGGSM